MYTYLEMPFTSGWRRSRPKRDCSKDLSSVKRMPSKMKLLVVLLCALNSLQCFSNGSRILAIHPFQARSHYSPFEPLLRRLAERGHEVKVVSHFAPKVEIANYRHVDISTNLPSMVGTMPLWIVENFTTWVNVRFVWEQAGPAICRPVLDHPGVKELLESDEEFDLIISEVFSTDCFLGFVHKFRAQYVGVISSVAVPWLPDAIGNPDNPSYIPQLFSRYSDRMNYLERFTNAFYLLALKLGHKFYSDKPSYEIAKDYFGPDLPSLDDLRSKVDLVLVNGHHSVTTPRALAPGVKEVGGIHIPISGPGELPKDLKDYLDSAKEGVVYFSLGSQLNSTTFPQKNLAILLEAFAELPQRVLWKCAEREMPQLPRNVKCLDWVPQLSVLCHPNVRVFFSHGGLLGTQEAAYCGVPILGMPLFGDQFANVAYGAEQGYALKADFYDPSYKELSDNLKLLLTDKSFSDRAKEVSRRFRDRPQAPLEEAVFWVEYVLRHGPGALRTAAAELAWYQYLLLDVVAGIFIVFLLLICILRRVAGAIFADKKHAIEKTKSKKN